MKEKFLNLLHSPAVTAPLLMVFVIGIMSLSRYALYNLGEDTNVFMAIGVTQLAVLGLPCIIYYLIKGRKLASPVMLVTKRGVNVFFVLFAAMFCVSGMLLIKYFYFVNGGTVAEVANFYGEFSNADEADKLTVIISLIIIPAVCEELFFHGILLSEYRVYGTANAIIVSAVFFAVLHFSIKNFFVYLFAGLLFGFVTAMTRSILPAIALHLMNNTLSIFASDSFLRVIVIKNGAYFIGFVLTLLTAVSFLLMMSRVESICYNYAENPPDEALPAKSRENFFRVFLSPTFLLLAAVFAVLNLL
ncbi:MAG: CPBP family intramembrane metalloprotease [Clostridia bacterium]|nr:CPBP family intramembrane metalloprotease [Clostridia bacterium]